MHPNLVAAMAELLKKGSRDIGSVPLEDFLRAVVGIEKAKTPLPDDWFKTIAAPEKRWRLIYTAGDEGQAFNLDGITAGTTAECNALQGCSRAPLSPICDLAHLAILGP